MIRLYLIPLTIACAVGNFPLYGVELPIGGGDLESPAKARALSAASAPTIPSDPLSPAIADDEASLLTSFDDAWGAPSDAASQDRATPVQFLGEPSFANAGHGNSPAVGGALWQAMPQGLIYKPYLAGAKESRFRSVWNHERNDGNIWDITLGGNVGLVRYGTRGDQRPQGVQLGIEGGGLVRLDRDENIDVDAVDFRFGVPLTWGDEVAQWKFAYYHLSSHVGDEFLLKNVGFQRLNYSRDALVLGRSHSLTPWLRAYAEVGYAFYVDVAKPWETQFGFDYAPPGATGGGGAPFFAVNGSLREEVDYGGNFVVQTGWGWRRSPASGFFRLGGEYYNGKDDQFSFFNQSVQKVGFGLWYDY